MGEEDLKNRGRFVFETLKREVLDLRFKPGQVISENDTRDRSSVPGTPVRGVLRLLQEQDFVETVPYRGTHVTLLNLDNIKQMIYMRIAVETMVFKDFAQARTSMIMEDIQHTTARQKALTQEPGSEPEQFYHINAQIHSIWLWAVKRQKLWEMLQAQQPHYTRSYMLDPTTETGSEHIIGEREELFQPISQGDEKGLEGSLKEHSYYSMKRMRHFIEVDYKDHFEEESEEGRFVI